MKSCQGHGQTIHHQGHGHGNPLPLATGQLLVSTAMRVRDGLEDGTLEKAGRVSLEFPEVSPDEIAQIPLELASSFIDLQWQNAVEIGINRLVFQPCSW